MVHILFATLGALALFAVDAGTNAAGKKFLKDNKAREGVITLPSGLQYKVLKEGDGENHPTADSPCDCHYVGTTPGLTPDASNKEMADWIEFDSSYKRGDPTQFAPNQVIKGWTEAMQLMVEGDKWEMYIPSELGYGDGGSGEKIKGGDVLIFRMEIIKITGGTVPANKCDIATLNKCDNQQKLLIELYKTTPLAGLKTKTEEAKNSLRKIESGIHSKKRKLAKRYTDFKEDKAEFQEQLDLRKSEADKFAKHREKATKDEIAKEEKKAAKVAKLSAKQEKKSEAFDAEKDKLVVEEEAMTDERKKVLLMIRVGDFLEKKEAPPWKEIPDEKKSVPKTEPKKEDL